jgi:hypothetical protein
MKKMIFGCTLLIMGTMIMGYSLGVSIIFWICGLIFAVASAVED